MWMCAHCGFNCLRLCVSVYGHYVQRRLPPVLHRAKRFGCGCVQRGILFLAGRSVQWLLSANECLCWWTRLFLTDTHTHVHTKKNLFHKWWKNKLRISSVKRCSCAVYYYLLYIICFERRYVHTHWIPQPRRQGHKSPPTHKCNWMCMRVLYLHSSTCNIVPVCVISHVPSKYNLYYIFITCILSYDWPQAQDIKCGGDCVSVPSDSVS